MVDFNDADFDSISSFLSTATFDELERRFYAEPPQDFSYLEREPPCRKLSKSEAKIVGNERTLSDLLGLEF